MHLGEEEPSLTWTGPTVFTYIAECYEIYASSGLAAQSWL